MRVPSRLAHAVGLLLLSAVVASCELAGKLDGLQGGCPKRPGATQVKVSAAKGDYCIDTTEATVSDYVQFLASNYAQPAADVPAGCTAGASNVPNQGWPADPGFANFPVPYVNWCQATAFCQWAGKRLCGEIGGGPIAPTDFTTASDSQWFNACSNDGALTYPYGNTYDATACIEGTRSQQVKSNPKCVGGVPGLFDMSGSLWEWSDSCGSASPTAFCDTWGGGFDSNPAEFDCASERNWTRTASAANIGIRCCSDL